MTDEYTARERALTLAHADSRDIILPAEDVIELAEKYLVFLMPDHLPKHHIRWAHDDAMSFRPQLHKGGIAG